MRNVIVEVPFLYTAQVVPPGKRKAIDVAVSAIQPVSIRVAEDAEFPVAALFSDLRSAAFAERSGPDDLRWDGRSLYRPWTEEGPYDKDRGGFDRFRRGMDDMLARLPLGNGSQSPFQHLQGEARWRQDVVPEGDIEGRVDSSDRREKASRIVQRAMGLVACGDTLYEACPEPCWKLTDRWSVEAILSHPEPIAQRPEKIWRADEFEHLVSLEFGGERPREIVGTIEVLDPAFIRLAVEGDALIKAADALRKQMEEMLPRASREGFALFADLRDALLSAAEGEPEKLPVTEQLVSAVDTVLDAGTDNPALPLDDWRLRPLRLARARLDIAQAREQDAGTAPSPGRR